MNIFYYNIIQNSNKIACSIIMLNELPTIPVVLSTAFETVEATSYSLFINVYLSGSQSHSVMSH